jgi:hypothetical protein
METRPTPRLLGGVPAIALFLSGVAIMQVGLINRIPILAVVGAACGIGAGVGFLVRRKLSMDGISGAVRMVPLRTYVVSFLAPMLLLAVALAAINSPSPHLIQLVRTAVVLAIALALMAAVAKRGQSQAFWAGFAILAAAHEYLLSEGFQRWQFAPFGLPPAMALVALMFGDPRNNPAAFMVGYSLMTLLFGVLGGFVCVWMWRRSAPRSIASSVGSIAVDHQYESSS